MRKVQLQDYQIVIEGGLADLNDWLSKQTYSTYFVIVDEVTNEYCFPLFKEACSLAYFEKIVVPEGEIHKNLRTCESIWEELLTKGADRNALVLNLGGGVVGDMGGFAASCFKRGIDFINIPTTILSQVDASIGGKLGVDFHYGKNLIGMFKNPKRVHISTIFHQTLSDRQFLNGFAEIYKHTLIGDSKQWNKLKGIKDLRSLDMLEVLEDALMVKKNIVDEDPFEKGVRKALNFGHTFGHAIEAYSLENDEHPIFHGEGVILGMIMEAWVSVQKCGLSLAVLEEITSTLAHLYPTYEVNDEEALWAFMQLDKKNERKKVMAALIKDIGQPIVGVELTREDLKGALEYYKSVREKYEVA